MPSYRPRYEIEVRHDGLGTYRHITGSDPHVVEQKARSQRSLWDTQWRLRQATETLRKQIEEARADKDTKKRQAAERTRQAQASLDAVRSTLAHTLAVDDAVSWDALKDSAPFSEPPPAPPKPRATPAPDPLPAEPAWDDYAPKLTVLDRMVASRRREREAKAETTFEAARSRWSRMRDRVEADNERARRAHDEVVSRETQRHEEAVRAWEARRQAHLDRQAEQNRYVEGQRAAYERADPGAVLDYVDLVLSTSAYPDSFPKTFELDLAPDARRLLVDYDLPAPSALPSVKEVRYTATKDEFTEVPVTTAEANRLYDDVLYQIALRTLHELFESDTAGALETVVFNGWVTAIDPATGRTTRGCVLTVQARKDEFEAINLAAVDPKACFKSLKGVGSAKLHTITPVAPLVRVDRTDARFVEGYAVVDGVTAGDNLAAMGWEDFEHLIRELFEQEFAAGGGEVRVTQASRDGGVDAVVFDPDPIRGGKIVVQAKRYTNTVGVSAVRDLYGTVLNEGANKGILVTTSDYGPDAYAFAKGKPLTLLDGGNLLFLLEKHGHRARIDLKEARANRLSP